MSFRLFIYYCALCGGWAAFFGWAMGKPFVLSSTVKQDGIRGMLLGLCVALGLSALDAVEVLTAVAGARRSTSLSSAGKDHHRPRRAVNPQPLTAVQAAMHIR
jgi:hypothetical protein